MTTYKAEITMHADDGSPFASEFAEGREPAVIAAWLRAQAERLDPQRPVMRLRDVEMTADSVELHKWRALRDRQNGTGFNQ